MDDMPSSDSRIILTQLMGPGSANIMGNVHGGYIMRLSDEAGGMAASKHARRPTFVPPVLCQTREEKARFQRAARRQERRLESREQDD